MPKRQEAEGRRSVRGVGLLATAVRRANRRVHRLPHGGVGPRPGRGARRRDALRRGCAADVGGRTPTARLVHRMGRAGGGGRCRRRRRPRRRGRGPRRSGGAACSCRCGSTSGARARGAVCTRAANVADRVLDDVRARGDHVDEHLGRVLLLVERAEEQPAARLQAMKEREQGPQSAHGKGEAVGTAWCWCRCTASEGPRARAPAATQGCTRRRS